MTFVAIMLGLGAILCFTLANTIRLRQISKHLGMKD